MKLVILFLGFLDLLGTVFAYLGKLSKHGIWVLVALWAVTTILLVIKAIIQSKPYFFKIKIN